MVILPKRVSTQRLLLRPPVLADAEAIFQAYAQDPVVCRYMDWAPHASVADTHAFIARCLIGWQAGTPLPYVITDPDAGPAIGMIEARVLGTTIDIGYVLARSRWGSGLMPEAIRVLTDACLARAEVFRVQAMCDMENAASARALEKSGFLREGRLERYGIHPNVSPEPRACFMYARTR
ncbi:MAG: GNAT family N-acetyltransferase [Gammaproteobacteria bacterium]